MSDSSPANPIGTINMSLGGAVWTIDNYSDQVARVDVGELIPSPTFSTGDTETLWQLYLEVQTDDNDYLINIYLLNVGDIDVVAKANFSLLDVRNNRVNSAYHVRIFRANQTLHDTAKLVHKEFFRKQENDYVVNDKLRIFCKLEIKLKINRITDNDNNEVEAGGMSSHQNPVG